MEITKISKKNKNTYEVTLKDLTKLSLFDDTIIHFNLLNNKKVTKDEVKDISEYNERLTAYYKGVNLINFKLRTKKEITDKLKKLNYSDDSILNAIKRLEKEGYINDEGYLKSYITDQVNLTLKGPNKIMMELIKLGFSKDKIILLLDNYDSELWFEKINKIVEKKNKSNHNLSNNMFKEKLKKDLYNMGYYKELVYTILNSMEFDSDIDILKKEYEKEYKKLARKYEGSTLSNKLKYNLYKKGFSLENIESIING